MLVSRKDVAQRAGVSEATVSRVLNGLEVVKPDTRLKVLAAAEELSYRPSAIAQSFARGSSGNVGVVLPVLPKVHLFSTYYFAEICSGIGQALSRLGHHMLILFLEPTDSGGLLQAFETRKIDGCILPGAMMDKGLVDALVTRRHPLCLVSQRHASPEVYAVDADHVAGARNATAHLVRKGHRRIAFLNGPIAYSNSVDRLSGYRMALAEAGIDFDDALLAYGNYSRTSGYQAVDGLLAMRPQPTAVFAANDRMAAGLIAGLRERGVRPGKDIAVVGYDDADIATITDPPLTTVRVPFFHMGEQAASMLVQQIQGNGNHDSRTCVLATELVIRASCGETRIAKE